MSLHGCISTSWQYNTVSSGYTIIHTGNTIDNPGTITQWCCKIDDVGSGSFGVKLKVFRSDGTNFNYIGESALETVSGSGVKTFSTSIPNVQAGDILGIYRNTDNSSGWLFCSDSETSTGYRKSGDISSNSAISTWDSGYNRRYALNAFFQLAEVYINSSTGNDSNAGDSCAAGRPVQTFAKAYDLLASGGTIHCCGSGYDFSGETVTRNKSYYITVEGGGYFYDAKSA